MLRIIFIPEGDFDSVHCFALHTYLYYAGTLSNRVSSLSTVIKSA